MLVDDAPARKLADDPDEGRQQCVAKEKKKALNS
jgi:hypothetical protein